MNKPTAIKLAARITQEDPLTETQWRAYSYRDAEVVICDHRTGYTAVLRSPEDWEDRKRAATWPVVED